MAIPDVIMTLQIYNYSLIGLSNKEPVMTPLKQRMHIVLCNTMFYLFEVWPFYIESTLMTLLLQGVFIFTVSL